MAFLYLCACRSMRLVEAGQQHKIVMATYGGNFLVTSSPRARWRDVASSQRCRYKLLEYLASEGAIIWLQRERGQREDQHHAPNPKLLLSASFVSSREPTNNSPSLLDTDISTNARSDLESIKIFLETVTDRTTALSTGSDHGWTR
jgi:hypothetical protein